LQGPRVFIRSKATCAALLCEVHSAKAHLRADIPRLKRRAALLNNAIFLPAVSAIVTTFLVIVAFASAFFQVQHEHGVAALFVIALGFFAAALVNLAREARIALNEVDHYQS
jgi:Protein of unknown function (DUF2721)